MSRPSPPNRAHHLAVCVSDLGRAERFYVEILGLPVLRRHLRADGAERAVWLDLGDTFLALERVEGGPRRADDSAGWHCVALAIPVSARGAWIAHLTAHGVPIERRSDYTLYLRDPDGALVGLSHYPDTA